MSTRRTIVAVIVALCFLMSGTPSVHAADVTYKIAVLTYVGTQSFMDEMSQLGYTEGTNVTYMVPSYENVKPEDFANSFIQQVQAMIDAKVDLIVAATDSDAANLRKIAGNIPIVFAISDDPIATGAVSDLVSPGGLTTGVVSNKHHERRLELLTEIKPTTKKVYYMYSSLTLEAGAVLKRVQEVAQRLNVEIIPVPISDPASMTAAFDNAPADLDWFFLTPYVFLDPASEQRMLEQSITNHIGIASFFTSIPKGYLVGYGPNLDNTARQAAHITDRILRGASPKDLPVETAENFFTINLEAAATINLNVPESVLRQANLIIRPGYFDVTPTPSN